MLPTVAAIVINFNGLDCIASCLDSIYRQRRPFDEVIVVDNASEDRSLQLIRDRYRNVDLIASQENLGYAGGANRGVEHAASDLVAILNNDIILDEGWLEALTGKFDERWAMWASCITFAGDPERVDSAGDGMATVGSAYKIGHGDSVSLHLSEREVFGPCGAAALYRRSLFSELGGFDEDFFLIYEDADLNMRARLRGLRCLYVPGARVLHQVNRSIGTFSHNYVFYGHRNSEILFWKNMPASLLVRYFPARMLFNFLSFIYFSRQGRAASFIQAKWSFLFQIALLRRKRKRVQDSLGVSAKELRRALDGNWFRYRRKVLRKA